MENEESLEISELTLDELQAKEMKEKAKLQKILDHVTCFLPIIVGFIAILEYKYVPNVPEFYNPKPNTYITFLLMLMGIFFSLYVISLFLKRKNFFNTVLHKAPLTAAVFAFLILYDCLTLKSNYLLYPFFPWFNDILNAMIGDAAFLLECSLNTLKLLFYGYFSGVIVGLITGIICGYSKKAEYWVDPLIKILGPIPTATWIPLIMVIASTLFKGCVFIVALGVWFAVTTATMTGIKSIDKSYFEAAQNMGCDSKQLIFKIAIPAAVPNIFQGMTQGMSSACVALMVAEMIGVESGLGWYIVWAKAWANYSKMYASIIIICIIFTVVTQTLAFIRRRVLRWQEGLVR